MLYADQDDGDKKGSVALLLDCECDVNQHYLYYELCASIETTGNPAPKPGIKHDLADRPI